MDEVTERFKKYNVESIEMWISGVIESGGITKLLVSAKGEGGMKVFCDCIFYIINIWC